MFCVVLFSQSVLNSGHHVAVLADCTISQRPDLIEISHPVQDQRPEPGPGSSLPGVFPVVCQKRVDASRTPASASRRIYFFSADVGSRRPARRMPDRTVCCCLIQRSAFLQFMKRTVRGGAFCSGNNNDVKTGQLAAVRQVQADGIGVANKSGDRSFAILVRLRYGTNAALHSMELVGE